jgi:hypothetical protein
MRLQSRYLILLIILLWLSLSSELGVHAQTLLDGDSREVPIDLTSSMRAPQFSTHIGSIENYTTDASDPDFCSASEQPITHTVWFTFVPAYNSRVVLHTIESMYDTVMGVFSGSPGVENLIACNDNPSKLSDFYVPYNSRISLNVNAGQRYYVMVGAVPGQDIGTYSELSFSIVLNDVLTGAFALPAGITSYRLTQTSVLDATWSGDYIFTCQNGRPTRGAVWYIFQPPTSGYYVISTANSDYDTVLAVLRMQSGTATSLGCNNNYNGTAQSRLRVYLQANRRYYIEVAAQNYTSGNPPSARLNLVIRR